MTKEECKKYNKEYYRTHKDSIKNATKKYKSTRKEQYKEYYKKYKEKSSEYYKTRMLKNPQKVKEGWIRGGLKKRFNMTLEEYNLILEKQENKCFICRTDVSLTGKRLHVDHDHKNGKIRGLLCNQCNLGLGAFKDNIELFKKAIEYLQINN
jgi:hypothetical protein